MSNQTPEKRDPEQREDFKLKAAGWGYIFGDAAMIGAAVAREVKGNRMHAFKEEATSAAIWMAGGVGAAIFGNPNVDRQVQIQAGKLQDYLVSQGIKIPQDAKKHHEIFKDRNVWEKIVDFCYEHPSELLNASYAIGATFLLKNGIKQTFFDKSHTILPKAIDTKSIKTISQGITALGKSIEKMSTQLWIGSLVFTGATIGLFAKEDHTAKEKAENGNVIDKAFAFVTEKPLRVSAGLYMANNLFLGLKFVQDLNLRSSDFKNHPVKPHLISGAQLGLYIASNILLMMSSRNQITDKGFDDATRSKFEEAAASVIAEQPVEQHETLIKNVSQFMSKQPGIKLTPEQLESSLRERLQPKTTISPAAQRHAERMHQRELVEQAHHAI